MPCRNSQLTTIACVLKIVGYAASIKRWWRIIFNWTGFGKQKNCEIGATKSFEATKLPHRNTAEKWPNVDYILFLNKHVTVFSLGFVYFAYLFDGKQSQLPNEQSITWTFEVESCVFRADYKSRIYLRYYFLWFWAQRKRAPSPPA